MALRVLATLALAMAFGLTLLAPAEANTRRGSDPRGDAPPAVDMTRVQATYGVNKLHIEIRIPGLRPVGAIVVAFATEGPDSSASRYLDIERTPRGRVKAVYNFDDDGPPVRCKANARWSVRAGFVGATVDSSCIDVNRFGLTFFAVRGDNYDGAKLRGIRRG